MATISGTGLRRAIIGVIALYAVVIQAFAAGMRPVDAAAASAFEICAPDAGHGRSDGQPHGPLGHLCCLAACSVSPAAGSPGADPLAIVWPSGPATRVAWAAADTSVPGRPPDPATSARGPPSA